MYKKKLIELNKVVKSVIEFNDILIKLHKKIICEDTYTKIKEDENKLIKEYKKLKKSMKKYIYLLLPWKKGYISVEEYRKMIKEREE